MPIKNFKENIEKHFESFTKTGITLEMPTIEKIRIIDDNKNRKALIKVKDFPDEYIFGKLEPKNGIMFGLKATKNYNEFNYFEVISYENLSELIICKD